MEMNMKYEIVKTNDLCKNKKLEIVDLVSSYTNGLLGEVPQMLPVSEKELEDSFMAFVALEQETGNLKLAGYVRALDPVEHLGLSMSEAGTLWVPAEYRRMGIGLALGRTIINAILADGHLPYVFGNEKSSGLFKQTGCVTANFEQIPAIAFEACNGCSSKPSGGGCCDEMLIYCGEKS
jgi:N-acetylglutamate synthase-like GNAT family acetyltransferase